MIDASKMLLIDGVERRVELGVALLGREALGERAGEAGDDAGVAGQPIVGLLAGVAAREGDDAQHARVLDQLLVEVVGLGQRQLEHDRLVGRLRVELRQDRGLEQRLGLGLLGAV